MTLVPSSSQPGGTAVTSVTAGDASIVVAGTATLVTITTGRLDQVATLHAPTAAVPMNAQKLTGVAAASAATDAATLAATLDQFAAPAGNVAWNSKKITALANGTAISDAAAFGQVLPNSTLPCCRAFNSAAISINNTTLTSLTFDSERYDTDNMHSTVSNTGRLTATTAGRYAIGASVEFAGGAGTLRIVRILLNGATGIANFTIPPVSGNITGITVTCEYQFAAADFVTIAVFQDSGGALNVNATGNYSPEAWMNLISA